MKGFGRKIEKNAEVVIDDGTGGHFSASRGYSMTSLGVGTR